MVNLNRPARTFRALLVTNYTSGILQDSFCPKLRKWGIVAVKTMGLGRSFPTDGQGFDLIILAGGDIGTVGFRQAKEGADKLGLPFVRLGGQSSKWFDLLQPVLDKIPEHQRPKTPLKVVPPPVILTQDEVVEELAPENIEDTTKPVSEERQLIGLYEEDAAKLKKELEAKEFRLLELEEALETAKRQPVVRQPVAPAPAPENPRSTSAKLANQTRKLVKAEARVAELEAELLAQKDQSPHDVSLENTAKSAFLVEIQDLKAEIEKLRGRLAEQLALGHNPMPEDLQRITEELMKKRQIVENRDHKIRELLATNKKLEEEAVQMRERIAILNNPVSAAPKPQPKVEIYKGLYKTLEQLEGLVSSGLLTYEEAFKKFTKSMRRE